MKDLKLLVWMTQLGLSTALPLAGFVFLALWLRNTFSLGNWVLWVGIIIGVIAAILWNQNLREFQLFQAPLEYHFQVQR